MDKEVLERIATAQERIADSLEVLMKTLSTVLEEAGPAMEGLKNLMNAFGG